MSIPVLVLLGVAALAIIGIVLSGRAKSPPPERASPVARRTGTARTPAVDPTPSPELLRGNGTRAEPVDKFRGTTLFPQPEACEAAHRLRGKTFEAPEILRVPVTGCDRGQCQCQIHEVVGRRRSARRVMTDRRSDVRFASDRRTGPDRRKGGESWQQAKD